MKKPKNPGIESAFIPGYVHSRMMKSIYEKFLDVESEGEKRFTYEKAKSMAYDLINEWKTTQNSGGLRIGMQYDIWMEAKETRIPE